MLLSFFHSDRVKPVWQKSDKTRRWSSQPQLSIKKIKRKKKTRKEGGVNAELAEFVGGGEKEKKEKKGLFTTDQN